MMQQKIFPLFHCTLKIGDHIATIKSINNTVQKANDEINNFSKIYSPKRIKSHHF